MYSYPDAVILLFCKAPEPGQVKTRLSPPLTPEEAAQLHCELTERTLQTATADNLCPVELWCAPVLEHPYFVGLEQTYPLQRKLQQGGNLGERMQHAFCDALRRYKHAILIGCDCPSLTPDDLEQGIKYLAEGIECVLAPAEDGGYVLIGLNHTQAELFENMPWGSPEVFALTNAKAVKFSLKTQFLKPHWDVDNFKDFQRYRKQFTLLLDQANQTET